MAVADLEGFGGSVEPESAVTTVGFEGDRNYEHRFHGSKSIRAKGGVNSFAETMAVSRYRVFERSQFDECNEK